MQQAAICTTRARDHHDIIIVQEKLDGSCCAVAKLNGEIVALQRAGFLATSSPFVQHHYFAEWVAQNTDRFNTVLEEGERIVGEWLAQVHGTRYNLRHEPFVAFDIMRGTTRQIFSRFFQRCDRYFTLSDIISIGPPVAIEDALARLQPSHHGALDPIEGAVWRVERNGAVDFLAKYVRPDKVDGCYLPEQTGHAEIWNWRPQP